MDVIAPRRRLLLAALLVAAALVVGSRLVFPSGGSHPDSLAAAIVTGTAQDGSALGGAPSSAADAVGAAAGVLTIDVVGAVRRPGLYRLPPGSRIAAAVSRAGGATPRADVEALNLAALLVDGEQVVVPRRGAAVGVAAAGPSAEASPRAPGPLQLSTATAEELDALPGIGPVTAQRIVDYRTAHGSFASVDDLDEVPGIGPARVDQLRGLVVP